MKVARMTVRMLEAETAFAEVHLAGDPRVHHPLQGAIDRGAADPMILALDQIDEIVRAQVAFLAQEDIDDQIALAGSLAAGGPQAFEFGWRGSRHRPQSPPGIRR
jgi:hypothetical protein